MAYGKPGSRRRKSLKKKPNKKTVNKDGSVTFTKKSSVRRTAKAGSIQGPRKSFKTKVTVAQMKPSKQKTLMAAVVKKKKKKQS